MKTFFLIAVAAILLNAATVSLNGQAPSPTATPTAAPSPGKSISPLGTPVPAPPGVSKGSGKPRHGGKAESKKSHQRTAEGGPTYELPKPTPKPAAQEQE